MEINWFLSTHCQLNKFINCNVYFFHPAYCWSLWCTFAASPWICRLDVFLVDRCEIFHLSLVENRLFLAYSCQRWERQAKSRCPRQNCHFAGVERLLSHDCCYKGSSLILHDFRHTRFITSLSCVQFSHTCTTRSPADIVEDWTCSLGSCFYPSRSIDII